MRCMQKTTLREIRGSLGRFLAIAAITCLGVGLFSGLKVCTPDMIAVTDDYLRNLHFYDYQLVNTLGYTAEEVSILEAKPEVLAAEGTKNLAVLCKDTGEEQDIVLQAHLMPEKLNLLELVEGRLPENSAECVVDARYYGSEKVGTVLRLSEHNEADTLAAFSGTEYTIVGRVYSPLYLNYERGTTSLGGGSVAAFFYLPEEAFQMEAYTSIYAQVTDQGEIYSKEYEAAAGAAADKMEQYAKELAENRVNALLAAVPEAMRPMAEVPEVSSYVLDRESNVGYVCFNNDAHIVEGIAAVFPAFFILVAALVCMTTMNRMMEEQRTQVGVLKALGYSPASIMGKYMTYSGLAAVLGCVSGFYAGSYAFPTVIWKVYDIMYGFTDKLLYRWDYRIGALCLCVSLACTVGATYGSIAKELREVPAELIRPKAPKNGKRILLERVTFVWSHMQFLHKVSFRNVVRYRKRFFMMVIGIAGCTALLITGYGIRDSISGVAKIQFDEIEQYDYSICVTDASYLQNGFAADTKELLSDYAVLSLSSLDISAGQTTKPVKLVTAEEPRDLERMVKLKEDGKPAAYPGDGEVILTDRVAEELGVSAGDTVSGTAENGERFTVTVSAVCENHVYDYMFMNDATYRACLKKAPAYTYVYAKVFKGQDVYETGAKLLALEKTARVTVVAETKDRFDNMLGSIDYIVLLVIACAAALAFIVLYNLTNINITERLREIATIKVLGFYDFETSLYVFRENMMLTILGALAGIPLGKLLHWFVMSRIRLDLVSFENRIAGSSYAISLLLTMVFALAVDAVMHIKLQKIDMAESLKSIE